MSERKALSALLVLSDLLSALSALLSALLPVQLSVQLSALLPVQLSALLPALLSALSVLSEPQYSLRFLPNNTLLQCRHYFQRL